jgi:MFS family permease
VFGLVNDRLRQEHRVAASSGLILAFGLGAVLGPPGAGWLMAQAGPTALLAWVGGVLGATGGFAAYRRLHGPPVTLQEQTQHVAVVARTPSLTAAMVESPEQVAGVDTRESAPRN